MTIERSRRQLADPFVALLDERRLEASMLLHLRARPPGSGGGGSSICRAAVFVLILVLAFAGCAQDPDAEARDRASDEARSIAEGLALPDGYTRGAIDDSPAATPEENRGGGQGGSMQIRFQAPGGVTPADVLAAFDEWATSLGYERAEFGANNHCDSDNVVFAWAADTHVVSVSYAAGREGTLRIPYGFDRIVTGDSSSVTPVSVLVECEEIGTSDPP